MVHFYDVEGVLVRRWVPPQRRRAMEAWNGDGWAPFSNADDVSRRGRRLSADEAELLLATVRARRATLPTLSHDEAQQALIDRRRRA